jgi:signal peptidase II
MPESICRGGAGRRSLGSMRLPRLTLLVAGLVVVVDAVSKLLVTQWLVGGRVVHVGPLLELDLYYNHAGAGNALTGRPVLVTVLSALATAALAVMAARVRSRGMSLGLGFLLGGGIGNLVDRLFGAPGPMRGGVIDWLRPLNGTGSMNVADWAINLGLVVLGLTVVHQLWSSRRAAPNQGARSHRPGTAAT